MKVTPRTPVFPTKSSMDELIRGLRSFDLHNGGIEKFASRLVESDPRLAGLLDSHLGYSIQDAEVIQQEKV